MPAPRVPDRSRIEDALSALSGALSEVGAPWMVIGGIAVIAHGVQRMTTDIDAVIQGDAVSVPALIEVLQRHHIVPRIDDAEAFAATNLVLLTRHQPTEVDLDPLPVSPQLDPRIPTRWPTERIQQRRRRANAMRNAPAVSAEPGKRVRMAVKERPWELVRSGRRRR